MMNFINGFLMSFFPSSRGSTTIREYFNSPYNNAIYKLTAEGYELENEFTNLCHTYQLHYTLNQEELFFIDKIKNENLKNHFKLNKLRPLEYELFINNTRFFIKLYKETLKEMNLQYEWQILRNNCDLLEKELKKLRPIYEAVIMRKFIKKILEILIKKNIKEIKLINYIPNINILNSYLNCLKMYYMKERGGKKDIQSEVNNLIEKIKNNKKSKEDNLKNSQIKYSNESKEIVKVIKLLFAIKNYCNQLIHPKCVINFNINEYISHNNFIYDNNDNYENEDTECNRIIETNLKVKNSLSFPISKILDFIAYGKDTHVLLIKLKELSMKIKAKMEQTQNRIKEMDYQEKEANYYIEKLTSIQQDIDDNLKNLILSENFQLLNRKKVKNIITYLNNNFLNLENIPLSVAKGDKDEEKNIKQLNDILSNLDIYKRLKFNLTFNQNLELIDLKKEIIHIMKKVEIIKEIENNINDINFKDDLEKIKTEIDGIDKQIFIFERKKFFSEISQEKFLFVIEKEFSSNKSIDVSGKEITDFYFFIYLLKMDIYHEKSYKAEESVI